MTAAGGERNRARPFRSRPVFRAYARITKTDPGDNWGIRKPTGGNGGTSGESASSRKIGGKAVPQQTNLRPDAHGDIAAVPAVAASREGKEETGCIDSP